jgi:hypothetical protein
MIHHRLTYNAGGVLVERFQENQVVAQGNYESIKDALSGLEIALSLDRENALFPGMTAAHIDAERLALAIEGRLNERGLA